MREENRKKPGKSANVNIISSEKGSPFWKVREEGDKDPEEKVPFLAIRTQSWRTRHYQEMSG